MGDARVDERSRFADRVKAHLAEFESEVDGSGAFDRGYVAGLRDARSALVLAKVDRAVAQREGRVTPEALGLQEDGDRV